ncbi:CaiB/BaiF CoA transferase family protein [Zwartia vadi]|uniref:CaiB/BaiF CoA transferase family protein n=1 Tax=Zwartia vadi TaxID=3058168 RepID=UPI0025B383A8|nr:CaiB/BaiF CoA-transferase family protein [Zwartia vadi]MDN3986573.1 CaiB/BaiF CoA-transferase family protein [Zwartia vadi]
MKPLKNIKVIDLSKVLAGPLCAQFLGELGANVIKIEPVGSGDDTRAWLPKEKGQSAMFLAVNHNKRSIALDLKSPDGQKIIHELVASADIILQGFGSGTAKKLAVDYETIEKINPRIIYLEISGYGRDGPLGKEPGYDVMLQAFSGMLSSMGDPDGGFSRASFSPVDLGTGSFALSGILAALLERQQTGKGVYVEVSLLDTSISQMGYMAQNYWRTGAPPRRMGTAHPAMSPYQAFETSDGYLMLGVGNDAQWRRFCGAIQSEALMNDPRFITNAARVSNFNETVQTVGKIMRTRSTDEWLDLLRSAGVPCSPINTLDQALEHPQVQSRSLFVETDHPVLGPMKNVGYPVKFNNQPRQASRHAPLLGEHTKEVLTEMGLSHERIDELLKHGVVEQA